MLVLSPSISWASRTLLNSQIAGTLFLVLSPT